MVECVQKTHAGEVRWPGMFATLTWLVETSPQCLEDRLQPCEEKGLPGMAFADMRRSIQLCEGREDDDAQLALTTAIT